MLWLRPLLGQTLVSFAAMSSSSSTLEAAAAGWNGGARVLISQPEVFARKKAQFISEGPGKLQVCHIFYG